MIFGIFPLESNVDPLLNKLHNSFIPEFSDHGFQSFNFDRLYGGYFLKAGTTDTSGKIFSTDNERKIFTLFIGNLYNRESLCRTYGMGQETSNHELVKALFLLNGPDFVNELNGDFAIIIYNADEDSVYLFRDHLGIYPLGYILEKGSLVFSSDLMGLCRSFRLGRVINMEPLLAEFRFTDLTALPNPSVKKLLPGHYLFYRHGCIEITQYWFPERIQTERGLTFAEAITSLCGLVEDAVHIRSNKGLKAAAHISGGLDSSLLSAMARKEYESQLEFFGYSWTPDDFDAGEVEFDERTLVRQVCNQHNITPVFVGLKVEDYELYSKNYIRNFGYFTEDKILRHASEAGVGLIFSGWGGDEFISKGERGLNSDLLFDLNWRLFFERNSIRKPKEFIRTLLLDIIFPAMNLIDPFHRRAHREFTRYLRKPFRREYQPSRKNFLFYRSRKQLHLGFLNYYHLSRRTELWYVNGFINGVEYRYPLLDKRIVEYMLKVPTRLLVKGINSRMILREIAAGYIPDEIRLGKKGADPVIKVSTEENCVNAALEFISEIEVYKSNQNLYFVDFAAIEKDIDAFKADPASMDTFASTIVIIKMLHEFSVKYMENIGSL